MNQADGFNNLIIEIDTHEDANEARTGLAVNRTMYSSNTAGAAYNYEALSGIGDGAFLAESKTPDVPAEMAGMLQHQQHFYLISGAKSIDIMANYSGKSRPSDELKALAKKLAEHF